MGFFSRTLLGAAGGAIVGGMTTGNLSGVGYGAAFGAGTGGLGPIAGSRVMANRTNVAGYMAGGLRGLGNLGLRATSTIGNRPLFNTARGIDKGLSQAASFIGRNQVSINKYGGMAATALGTAAAAHIGSTTLAANRPFGLNR